jgi:hypothetical protein
MMSTAAVFLLSFFFIDKRQYMRDFKLTSKFARVIHVLESIV